MSRALRNLVPVLALLLAAPVAAQSFAQPEGPRRMNKTGGSSNIEIRSHIPLGGYFRVTDIELEQELDRPFAYVSQAREKAGFSVIDLSDLDGIRHLYRWTIEDVDLHQGLGGMDGKYFKDDGRYYYVQSFQFAQGGPNTDLGAIVFDVTGLPDVGEVREAGRIREPGAPGGFHNIFMYKHSDGRPLLFTTTNNIVDGVGVAHIYDMRAFLDGAPDQGLIGMVPTPPSPFGGSGYHDFYIAYDPATGQDKFYGAGAGGYHVYDVTDPTTPELLFSLSGISGVTYGHTFTPTPDGAFAVTETEYQYAPLRLFDLRPGQRGEARNISDPISAWTADWRALSHNHEIRWPYVFVSAYEDGLQVFNMADPENPKTVAWYYTYEGPPERGFGGLQNPRGTSVMNGAFGVDIRNADGLIVLSDSDTGFWAFTMDGFEGWDGDAWGMPRISSVQDWDRGPLRAPDVTEDP